MNGKEEEEKENKGKYEKWILAPNHFVVRSYIMKVLYR